MSPAAEVSVSLVNASALSVSGLWFQGGVLCRQEWSAALAGRTPEKCFHSKRFPAAVIDGTQWPWGPCLSLEAGRAIQYHICYIGYIPAKRVLKKCSLRARQTPVPI